MEKSKNIELLKITKEIMEDIVVSYGNNIPGATYSSFGIEEEGAKFEFLNSYVIEEGRNSLEYDGSIIIVAFKPAKMVGNINLAPSIITADILKPYTL